jgi:hypothetical protein
MDLLARILGKEPSAPDTSAEAMSGQQRIVTILPSISASPSTGLQLGIGGNVVNRLGPLETTNLSIINGSVNYTTKGQLNVIFRSNVFLPGNGYKLEGDWRYLVARQPTFGLGRAQPESTSVDSLDYQQVRFYQTVYKNVGSGVLIGPGYLFDWHFDISDQKADAGLPSPVVDYEGSYRKSTVSSGLSLNALIDTRDSPVYATRGLLAYASARGYPTWMGSTNDWSELQLEVRTYKMLKRAPISQVIAFWGIARLTGGKAPYLDLPALGWDTNNRSGRGYLQGRIRGTNMLYGEAEYRVVLTRNGLVGLAGFVNATSASDATTRDLQRADFGAGGGLRIKLNKRSRSNITIDYAVGAQGSSGFFLSSSEAF